MRIRFHRKGCLYRHWDKDGRLLYIGESLTLLARIVSHRNSSHWFDDVAMITLEWFPDKRSAVEAETAAIIAERPLHNILNNKKTIDTADDNDPPVPMNGYVRRKLDSIRAFRLQNPK